MSGESGQSDGRNSNGSSKKQELSDTLHKRRMEEFGRVLREIIQRERLGQGAVADKASVKLSEGEDDDFDYSKWVNKILAGNGGKLVESEIWALFDACNCSNWDRQRLRLILNIYEFGIIPENVTRELIWFELLILEVRRAFLSTIQTDGASAEVPIDDEFPVGLMTLKNIIDELVAHGFIPDEKSLKKPRNALPYRNSQKRGRK